jgi:hypothetical protein
MASPVEKAGIRRDPATGRLVAGTAAGPGRTPLPPEFKAKGPEALAAIIKMMEEGEKDADRLKAAVWLAERIYGKPVQGVEVEGGEGVNGMLAALLALKGTKEGG